MHALLCIIWGNVPAGYGCDARPNGSAKNVEIDVQGNSGLGSAGSGHDTIVAGCNCRKSSDYRFQENSLLLSAVVTVEHQCR